MGTNQSSGNFVPKVYPHISLYMLSILESHLTTQKRDRNTSEKWHWPPQDNEYDLPTIQYAMTGKVLVKHSTKCPWVVHFATTGV